MFKFIRALLVFSLQLPALLEAQNLLVTYAGNGGNESFNDVIQLSNGHFIVAGAADNLDWISTGVPKIVLSNPGIVNNQGTGKVAFLAELSSDLQGILAVYHLPAGAAEDFRFIKTTNRFDLT